MSAAPTPINDPKIITCIIPAGEGKGLVDALYHERDVNSASYARGRGASQRSGTIADEMDILSVVVPAERADEVFEYLYDKAEVGEKRHRFMYQAALDMTSLLTLPDIAEETDD